jgi:serine/threonine-protein kinase
MERYPVGCVVSTSVPHNGLAEGTTLAGKYRIGRMLGSGGMCHVYEAEHIHLRQAVALKLLKSDLASDPTAVARFGQEAQAAAKLRSANVARVYDVDKLPEGMPYITMELLVGHDLGTELQKRFSLPVDLSVDYVRQAANGIAEAHALGIVHRDLKPENLFLTELGEFTERRLLKILDFGIAKNVHEGDRKLTAPDAVFGTVDYMSPEQIRSASTVDSRTDIWSLGVILYELVTGRTPYNGDARSVIAQIVSDPIVPPSQFVPTLPPGLVGIIMRALQKDPNHRFQTADELREVLTPYCETIEPITNVLARLPAASVPRRNVEAGTPSGSVRSAGTNLSFEAGLPKSVWSRRVVTIPALGLALATLLGVTVWKRDLFTHRRPAETPPAAAAADPSPVTATAAPQAPPVTTLLGVSSPPDPPTATPTAAPTHAKRSKAGPRSSAAAAPSHETAPAPAATPSALPKHL